MVLTTEGRFPAVPQPGLSKGSARRKVDTLPPITGSVGHSGPLLRLRQDYDRGQFPSLRDLRVWSLHSRSVWVPLSSQTRGPSVPLCAVVPGTLGGAWSLTPTRRTEPRSRSTPPRWHVSQNTG